MTLVRFQTQETATRLSALGLTEGELAQAVSRGILARSECTPNHPPLHAGFVTWSNTVCALREILLPKGWQRSDEGNYSVVIHPSRSVAIAVATGDENTGNPNVTPMTKSPKGPSTRNAIAENQNQVLLFPELIPVLPTSEPEGRLTWLLLIGHVAGKVKAELSLPINCEGKVNGWKERLILSDIDIDPSISIDITPLMPSLPDIEIDIRRKV
jgi:hypothetical protein